MNIGTIQGGTNAGWKRLKPRPLPWNCICGQHQPAYMTRCFECKQPRPTIT